MDMKNQQLIIIRGNSGSGKSAVAERLREEIDGKVAVIGLDTLRRTILKEPDQLENTDVIGLIEQTVVYSLEKGYTVIVEGILSKPKYKEVLMKLVASADYESHIYYIDVSLEETLKRHRTKPIADEVTDEQLASWYQPKNYLDVPGEIIIDESSTLEETVNSIKSAVL
jgi:predicted kinase